MDNSSKQHLAILWTPRDVQNPGRDGRNVRKIQSIIPSNWAVSPIIGDWTPSFLSSVMLMIPKNLVKFTSYLRAEKPK